MQFWETPVEDFMIFPVVTVTEQSDIKFVRELMERKQVSAILVVRPTDDKIELKGIVTSSDLRGVKDEMAEVEVFMSRVVECISKTTTAKEAAQRMEEKGMHHLVVMENDKIVGMLSSMDFVKLVVQYTSD